MMAAFTEAANMRYDAARERKSPNLPAIRNVMRIERLLDLDLGNLGDVQPGSDDEAMHKDLRTLPSQG